MKARKKITRRELLMGTGMTLLGTLLGRRAIAGVEHKHAEDPTLVPQAYLPLVKSNTTPTPTTTPPPMPGSPRVVHVHDPDATSWDFGNDYYGNFVAQDVADAMMDRGVMELTGAPAVAEAWRTIVPNYAPGRAIAIKVNLNNHFYCNRCETDCNEDQLKTDALIHPVNAVIRGLKQAYPNLEYSDIWVYDATVGRNPPVSERQIPDNVFADPCRDLYPSVRFFDQGCQEEAGYTSSDPSANITWRNPAGIPTPPSRQVTDVLVNATYLINMPIMKKHGGTEVTLSFKNHAGSLSNFSPFHDWTYHDSSYYSSSYNPLVDIYRNPHIQNKTVLTIADALFGNWKTNHEKSQPWVTFGNQAANSLLFATDPVAIDCVMCDLLNAENVERGRGPLRDMADDYLVLAAAAGLGVYERGDPWGNGYSQTDYRYVEL